MGEVVNLRRARKQQARRRDEAQAQENRISHGLSKAERQMAEKLRAQASKSLDGHLRDGAAKPDDPDASPA
jgi:hypothetical protein